jgi:hypothetical protein
MSLLAATSDAAHSAARLDAVYMSGEYGRRALPVEAHTTCGIPTSAAAVSTVRVPSTLVETVWCTSTSASPGSRCAATWNTRSGSISPISASMAARSLTSACRYSAPSCRGQSFEMPRLTLTRRPGHRAASWIINAEPMQPVPKALKASRSYYLATKVNLRDSLGPVAYYIWVKGHKPAPRSPAAKSKKA